ncbi:MAG: ATP-binding cassette domain-containing protein, partial [Gammaproteobacteria bacterium]|nr:ATP-binding cassette domain-containing protein [Gammaproteobacteria bacterium]
MADTNTTHPAIEARGLAKRYGEHIALAGIDLRVERGSCYALLGPNGAGKTTTVHILTTLIAATQGSARVGGLDVDTETRAARELLGIVFQESCLDPALGVREHLELSARLYHVRGRRERSRRVSELLG